MRPGCKQTFVRPASLNVCAETQVEGARRSTSVVRRDLNPVWNTKMKFNITDILPTWSFRCVGSGHLVGSQTLLRQFWAWEKEYVLTQHALFADARFLRWAAHLTTKAN